MEPIFQDGEFLKKLEYLAYLSKRIRKGSLRGEHLMYKKGASLEFRDHRAYNKGDDFRYIDWNVYSRLKKIFVKLFAAEEDLTIHILVDSSASMGGNGEEKLVYAKKLAAALGYIGLSNLEHVGLVSFGGAINSALPPIRRKNQSFGMFDFLSGIKAAGGTDLNKVLFEYSARKGRPGLVIVLSDFMDPRGTKDGILSLLYNKYDIILLHILSENEINPDLNGNLKIVDSETGKAVIMTVDKRTREIYRRQLAYYLKEMEDFSLKHGLEYMRVSVSIPFDEVILKYLRQGMYLH